MLVNVETQSRNKCGERAGTAERKLSPPSHGTRRRHADARSGQQASGEVVLLEGEINSSLSTVGVVRFEAKLLMIGDVRILKATELEGQCTQLKIAFECSPPNLPSTSSG